MGGIIKSDGNSSPDFLDLHREHSKNTFSIGVFDDLIFTIGYDRSLISYNLTEKDIQFNLPTFAGRVTCMASNSVDSSILALGSGDGLIKVWKTASTKSMFEYTTCFQKGFRGENCVLRVCIKEILEVDLYWMIGYCIPVWLCIKQSHQDNPFSNSGINKVAMVKNALLFMSL